jgi:ATP-independent RNA helicase DbpA
MRRLARFIPNLKLVTLCGGVPARSQTASLVRAPHVVVGTPGRVLDHLGRENLDLSSLRVLVLDEADRMLDMGFADSIGEVVKQTSRKRQTLLFSATIPDSIRRMSRSLQQAPLDVTVDTEAVSAAIAESFYECQATGKIDAVAALLGEHQPESTLVFCHTRNDTRDVANQLANRGYSVLALHGEMEQRDRDNVLRRFAHGSCSVLVATDVAARGLDVEGLSAVISYELPRDPDVHQHRIGRTGRAGRSGKAFSLCAPAERSRLAALQERRGKPLNWGKLRFDRANTTPRPPPMVTLLIEGGRKDKLRPGDFLGALTGDIELPGEAVGKIDILQKRTYLSVRRGESSKALAGLSKHKIKGRSFRVRRAD